MIFWCKVQTTNLLVVYSHPSLVTTSFLGPNILLSTLFSKMRPSFTRTQNKRQSCSLYILIFISVRGKVEDKQILDRIIIREGRSSPPFQSTLQAVITLWFCLLSAHGTRMQSSESKVRKCLLRKNYSPCLTVKCPSCNFILHITPLCQHP
jgi:hypothetical protein